MSMFERDGVDPVSRCTRCGAAVAAGGLVTHQLWHEHLALVLGALEQVLHDIADLQRHEPPPVV
jgi:hypothetical protein